MESGLAVGQRAAEGNVVVGAVPAAEPAAGPALEPRRGLAMRRYFTDAQRP